MDDLKKLSNEVTKTTNELISSNGNNFKLAFEKIGFKFVASGLDRRVYFSEKLNLILKVSKTTSEGQTKREVEQLKSIPKRFKKYFIPLLAYDKDYHWILVPKVKTFNKENAYETVDDGELTREESEELEEKLRDIFNEYDIYYGDWHNGNVGLLDGQPIIIDLGWRVIFPKARRGLIS